MHHQIRVTDENQGTRNLKGDWIDATYSINIDIDYKVGSETALLAALEAAASAALRQINATHREKAPE